jgi:hypothetical protein
VDVREAVSKPVGIVPRFVRGLEMTQEEERLAVCAVEPIERPVRDYVGRIPLVFDPTFCPLTPLVTRFFEEWIVIPSLIGKDVVVIESLGFGSEVPLSDHTCSIAGLLQAMGDVTAVRVDVVGERSDPVVVTVLAG